MRYGLNVGLKNITFKFCSAVNGRLTCQKPLKKQEALAMPVAKYGIMANRNNWKVLVLL